MFGITIVLYTFFMLSRIVSDRRYILVDCWQRAGVHGHLHRQGPAKDWKPVLGLAGDRRPFCGSIGHDVRSSKRPAGLLDVWCKIL